MKSSVESITQREESRLDIQYLVVPIYPSRHIPLPFQPKFPSSHQEIDVIRTQLGIYQPIAIPLIKYNY